MRLAALALAAALAAIPAARAADPPAELRTLFDEGRKWFAKAGDTDLAMGERNAARQEAWKSLWPAREILDRFGEENPGDAARVEREFGEIRMMVHWLRKESPVGLLERTGVGPKKGDDADGEGEVKGRPTGWGPKPPDGGTPPPPKPEPGTPAGSAPAPPATPAGPTPEGLAAEAEAYEKSHPFDLPGIQVRWMRVLEAAEGPGSAAVQRAAERVGDLETRLKDAYRVLRDEDPDSLEGIETERMKRMAFSLGRDLLSPDASLRERAARLLGILGRVEAVPDLRRGLDREKEEAPGREMVEALVRIGGAKAAAALGELREKPFLTHAGLDGLVRLSKRNPVDRRLAARQIARYAPVKDPAVFDRVMQTLRGIGGYDTAIGLAAALDDPLPLDRILAVVDALTETKEPAVAKVLARYLRHARLPAEQQIRSRAEQSIRRLAKPDMAGEEAIPYLFEGLRHPETRVGTTVLLQELTGQAFTVKTWGKWKEWWLSRHPGWKEKRK
jgi:hypothetical protein